MNNKKAKAIRRSIYGKDVYTGPVGRVYVNVNKRNYKAGYHA